MGLHGADLSGSAEDNTVKPQWTSFWATSLMVDTRISDQQLPTLRVQSGVTASDPTLASTLTPGAIVSVKIQREPGGQPGIVIDGKFVAATIPPQLEHDATVELLVVRNTPAILLRVVSLDPQPLQARPATLLDQAFRALLSGDDITGLKDAFRAVDRDIGQSLTTLTKSLDSAPSKNGSLKEVSLKLAHHLESLQVLDEPSLREPTTVMRSLEQALTRGIKPGEAALSSVNASIRSATAAIDELNRSLQEARQIPLALKTIETLRSEIAKLRGDPGGLSFGDLLPTLESGTEGSGALAVTSHSIAIAAGRSHAFTDVGRGRPPIDGEATPLVIFLRALGALLPELSREESPLHKELTLAVRQLRTEINRIAPGPQERAEIEAALSKAEQQLSALAREAAGRQSSATLLVTSADISKEIERVTEGQDILRFLAPLAQSVGEPIALFLPAVVHGLLTKFEFAFHPPPQAVDDESGDSAEEVDRFFERVDVTLPLPALGAVHVAVARRPSEVLINFTCSTSEADTFLKSLIPRLEELLEKLGYPKKLVASTVGEVPSALPTWCRTITRSNVVA